MLQALGGAGLPLRSTVMTGGHKYKSQKEALAGGVDVVIATPGRLVQHIQVRAGTQCLVDCLFLRVRCRGCRGADGEYQQGECRDSETPGREERGGRHDGCPTAAAQDGNLDLSKCRAVVLDEVDVLLAPVSDFRDEVGYFTLPGSRLGRLLD